MEFELSEEQLMARSMAHDFAEKEVRPVAMEYDRQPDPADALPLDLYAKGMAQGFHQMIVPARFDGAGFGALTSVVILEELAWGDAGYALTWHVNNIALTTLLNLGGADWAEPFVAAIMGPEGGVTAVSTTEPEGGVTSVQMIDPTGFVFATRARLEADTWVINGAKMFCSNSGLPFNRWTIVFCRADMSQTGWASTVPIVVPAGTPGFEITGEEDKMGHRLSNSVSFSLDDVCLPRDHAVGGGGRAIVGGSRVVTYEHDSAVAAISIGCARAAYETALEWAREREVLGKPIIKYQLIQAKIADMFIGLEAARALCYRTASYSDTHETMDIKLGRANKVFASETANRVVYEALQVLGGAGYSKGTITEKCYRDIRVTPIYEGTNEAQRISLSLMIENGV